MSKQQKRERRKIDQARRTRAHAKAAGALAAGAAIAAGTQAYAAPVRFDNPAHGEPGHFHWPPATNGPYGDPLAIYLPASSNPAWDGFNDYGDPIASPNTLQQLGSSSRTSIGGNAGMTFATQGQGGSSFALIPLTGGQQIGPHGQITPSYAYSPTINHNTYGSLLPAGEEVYVGLAWNQPDGVHYGWLGVVRDPSTQFVEAFAWGYETDAGIPIAAGAPEPGSLALLAFGVAGVAIRRRKSA